MQYIIGFITVTVALLGSYMAMGGHLDVLWQPFEFTLIGGAAIGSYIFGNIKTTIKATGKGIGRGFKGPKYKKEDYIELLCLLFQVFKLIKTKGILVIEQHIERPEESSLFKAFPKFSHNHHNLEFLCDYLRLWTMGSDKVHQFEDLIDKELEVHHEDELAVPTAVQTMADAFPALGIVAAVLGVIKTMGAISEPPEILGKLIGAALVGTFFGVLMSYGYVGPMASSIKQTIDMDSKYYGVIKNAMIAHLNGYAPTVSIEFARKIIPEVVRPSFQEVEKIIGELPPPQ